jgi:hypothetical protein
MVQKNCACEQGVDYSTANSSSVDQLDAQHFEVRAEIVFQVDLQSREGAVGILPCAG